MDMGLDRRLSPLAFFYQLYNCYRLYNIEELEPASVLYKVILPVVGVTKECERPE